MLADEGMSFEDMYRLADAVAAVIAEREAAGEQLGWLANERQDFHDSIVSRQAWQEDGESATYGRRQAPKPKVTVFRRRMAFHGIQTVGVEAHASRTASA